MTDEGCKREKEMQMRMELRDGDGKERGMIRRISKERKANSMSSSQIQIHRDMTYRPGKKQRLPASCNSVYTARNRQVSMTTKSGVDRPNANKSMSIVA